MEETGQKNNTWGVRYSVGDLLNESEDEKVRRLKNARVAFVVATPESLSKLSNIDVSNASTQQVEKLVFPLLAELGTFGSHYNQYYEVEFAYSKKAGSRSLSHQLKVTGRDFNENAIVQANLKELCKTAYPVESHEDEKPKEQVHEFQKVKEIITFFNTIQVGKDAIFVKMSVKVPRGEKERIHMVVASEKKEGLDLTLNAEADIKNDTVHSTSNSSPTIKLSQILENVKFIYEFAKRIPFEKILDSSDDRNIPDGKKTKDDTIDEEYMAAVERGDTELLDAYKDWVAALGEYDTYEKSPSTWVKNRYNNIGALLTKKQPGRLRR